MASLASWQLGDRAVEFIAQVMIAVALVSMTGVVVASFCRHDPAAKCFVLLCALLCVLVSPALVAAFLTSRISPLVIPLFKHQGAVSLASSRNDLNLHPNSDRAIPGPALDRATNRALDSRETIGAYTQPASPISQRGQDPSQVVSSPAAMGPGNLPKGRASVTVAMLAWAIGSLFLVVRTTRSWCRLRAIDRSLRFQTAPTLVDILHTPVER